MYLPTAAGHTTHEAPRAVTQEDIGELVRIAETWMEGMRATMSLTTRYAQAQAKTKNITTKADIAGFLPLHHDLQQHPQYWALGVFVSALWNEHCPEKVIVYPHRTPEIELGHSIPSQKILIVTGEIGPAFIDNGEGPILTAKGDGIIICSSSRQARCMRFYNKRLFCDHPCVQYLTQLIERAKSNPKALEQECGDGKDITARINELEGDKS